MPHSANAVVTPVQDDIINGCTASRFLHRELVWISVPGILTAIHIAKAFHPVAAEARLQLPSAAPLACGIRYSFPVGKSEPLRLEISRTPRALPELLNFY